MEDSLEREVVYRGPGICTLLAVLFIGLKLTGYITWSWLWVLAPIWIPFAIVLVILLVVLAIAAIIALKE